MDNFKQFLEEGRDAPLYHATDINSAEQIIDTNMLLQGESEPSHPGKNNRIISLTRSYDYAKSWDVIIFELDQRKINQRYKIRPFNYFNNVARNSDKFRAQSEESVINNDIKNISNYIIKIHISNITTYTKLKNEKSSLLAHPKAFYNGRFINA